MTCLLAVTIRPVCGSTYTYHAELKLRCNAYSSCMAEANQQLCTEQFVLQGQVPVNTPLYSLLYSYCTVYYTVYCTAIALYVCCHYVCTNLVFNSLIIDLFHFVHTLCIPSIGIHIFLHQVRNLTPIGLRQVVN